MAIEYQTTTYRTCEGNDNTVFSWCELSTSHVPTINGHVKRIALQCRSNSAGTMTTDPVYLGVWERQDDGGLVLLGCSKNAATQIINTATVWDFDSVIIRGKGLVLGLMSSPDSGWTNVNQLLFGARVKTNDADGCVVYGGTGRLFVTPDITFTVEYAEYVPDDEQEPEPEPEQTLREIDIRNYWRPAVGETMEFDQIAEAENPEFNKMQELIYAIVNENFVHTATNYGLSRYEKILKIAPEEGDTLDDRRMRILTYLNIRLPYTWRVLGQILTAFVGEGNYTMKYVNDTSTLTVEVRSEYIETVRVLMNNILPINIVLVLKTLA